MTEINGQTSDVVTVLVSTELLDLGRLIAIRWGDKVIDPTEVVYVLPDQEELRLAAGTCEHGVLRPVDEP